MFPSFCIMVKSWLLILKTSPSLYKFSSSSLSSTPAGKSVFKSTKDFLPSFETIYATLYVCARPTISTILALGVPLLPRSLCAMIRSPSLALLVSTSSIKRSRTYSPITFRYAVEFCTSPKVPARYFELN